MVEKWRKNQKYFQKGISREKYVLFVLINVAKQSTIVDCGQFHQSTIVD
jgi:hypothetical protein